LQKKCVGAQVNRQKPGADEEANCSAGFKLGGIQTPKWFILSFYQMDSQTPKISTRLRLFFRSLPQQLRNRTSFRSQAQSIAAAINDNSRRIPVNTGNLQGNYAAPVPVNTAPTANATQTTVSNNRHARIQYYRHGTQDFKGHILTVRELHMLQFMNDVTERPDWHIKVQDGNCVREWQAETHERWDLLDDMAIDWCITELQCAAAHYEENKWLGTFETSSRIIKSDRLVDEKLMEELRIAVEPLLNNSLREWRPDSNEQMLDLIDPSMYPLIFGKTRVLESDKIEVHDFLKFYGKPFHLQSQDVKEYWSDWHYQSYKSKYFQWLPTDVSFKRDGSSNVQIDSYINNLHPEAHSSLYMVIEKLISHSVPLWNHLVFLWDPENWDIVIAPPGIGGQPGLVPLRVVPFRPFFDQYIPHGLQHSSDWPDDRRRKKQKLERIQEYLKTKPEQMMYDPQLSERENIHQKWRSVRKPMHPNVNVDWEDWNDEQMDPVELQSRFHLNGLQIIVKLSSIKLTPEQPNYIGEDWHLDGMRNEYIVAASIYCYDVENVTMPSMQFQMETWLPRRLVQDTLMVRDELETIFGISLDDKGLQPLGSVALPKGRILAFPNTLQHKMNPISLQDKSKPGHCRFVTLLLVDPHERITSTAMVPPQQSGWLLNETWPTMDSVLRLPPEIKMMVEDELDNGLMTEREAKQTRLRVVEERLEFNELVQETISVHLSS
jgi:hypothetical protein